MSDGPSAPSIPSYTQVGSQQQALNQQSQQGSMVNQSNPFGSLTYGQTGTGANGTPLYSASESYSPQIQALFNEGTGAAGTLGGAAFPMTQASEGALPMSGYNYGQAVNAGQQSNALNATGLGEIASGNYGAGNNVIGETGALTSGIMGQYENSMSPFFQMQNNQLNTQLENAGLAPTNAGNATGSINNGTGNAYQNAMAQLQNSQGLTMENLAAQVQPAAYNEAATQYQLPATVGESLLGSGANLGQLGQGYSSTGYGALGAASTGLGGASTALGGLETMTPGISSTLTSTPALQPADLTSAYNTQVQGELSEYQAQMAQQNAMYGALGSMGGMGLLAGAIAL